jgi:hypothetical protein
MTPKLWRYLAALTIDPMKSRTAILHNQIRWVECGVLFRAPDCVLNEESLQLKPCKTSVVAVR